MTARVLISCDGYRQGTSCRASLLTRALEPIDARRQAERFDWTSHIETTGDTRRHIDHCPFCTQKDTPQ